MRAVRPIIAPSILSADFARLGEEVRAVEAAGADWIHVDVMDGHFVPNITIGPLVVEAVRRATRLPLDVHLMIEAPERYVAEFAKAGADLICVHAEACVHLHRLIQQIRELGKRPAVALNPATPVGVLLPVLEDLDMVVVMSVNPGFGGQAFIPSALRKIEEVREVIVRSGLPIHVEVDGGIKVDNVAQVAAKGADVFVSGSGIFGTKDYVATIRTMRERAGQALAVRAGAV